MKHDFVLGSVLGKNLHLGCPLFTFVCFLAYVNPVVQPVEE